MSSSSVIARGGTRVEVAHVCSQCDSVVVHFINLTFQGRSKAFFGAKKKAEEARDKALKIAIDGLRVGYSRPYEMAGDTIIKDPEDWTTSMAYHYQNIEEPCPCCGHIERWQGGKTGFFSLFHDKLASEREELTGIEYDNRPVLFTDEKIRDRWVDEMLHDIYKRHNNYWKNHPEELRRRQQNGTRCPGVIGKVKTYSNKKDNCAALFVE